MSPGLSYRTIIVLAIVVISCSQITVVNSQVIDCARLIMRVAKGILKLYGQCSKEFLNQLNSDVPEYTRRVDCVMKCVMGKVGILDEFHKVTNETLQVFFDKFIPEDYHEIGHIMMEGCTEEFSPLMDNEDELCHAYGDYVKCAQGVISEAC